MRPRIEAGFEARKTALKLGQRLPAAAGKARFFPDFIEAARIAGVAALQVRGPDPEPARYPDIDGVGLGQGAAGDGGRRLNEKRSGHGFLLYAAFRMRIAPAFVEPAAMRVGLTRRAIRD